MKTATRFTAILGAMSAVMALSAQALADDLQITIYNDDLSLVDDVRSINFANGRSVIELPNVSSAIDPTSVGFQASGVSIVEQNFDFDLLSPAKMMEKAVGQVVTIVRVNPGSGRETRQKAKVLSVNNGVIIEVDGKIEVLRDDNLPTRVIFDGVPKNLRAKPTLSVQVNSDRAGARDAKLTYLTSGLSWRADYVLLFDENAGKMDLQGWATLGNLTNTTFENVKTQLVAGNVNSNSANRGSRRSAGTEAGDVERIGDNYLYTLPGRTTIASKQTKQIGFVDGKNVDAAKIYEYRANGFRTASDPSGVDVRIAFSNSRASGLGNPLPQGIVRVYTKDKKGRAQYIGEDRIGHISGGSDLSLRIGASFDVNVQPTTISRKQVSKRVSEVTQSYKVTNATNKPVSVFIRQSGFNSWTYKTEILSENFEHKRPDADSMIWEVPVPAEGEATLTFTLRTTTRR